MSAVVAVATAEGELCFLLFVINHNFAFNRGFNRDLVTGNLDR